VIGSGPVCLKVTNSKRGNATMKTTQKQKYSADFISQNVTCMNSPLRSCMKGLRFMITKVYRFSDFLKSHSHNRGDINQVKKSVEIR
jgi:hypothetical protein